MPIHCPGVAPQTFSALYAVTPAHKMGASCSSVGPSGKGIRYRAGTTVYCPNVPLTFRPECICSRQRASPPSAKQAVHRPHTSRTQDTPTRSPILIALSEVKAEPTLSMRPTPSWPRIGRVEPRTPEASARSVPQTPVADSLTRTSRGPRSGSGSSSIVYFGCRPGSLFCQSCFSLAWEEPTSRTAALNVVGVILAYRSLMYKRKSGRPHGKFLLYETKRVIFVNSSAGVLRPSIGGSPTLDQWIASPLA
jgi:hypothetical protein